MKTTRLKKYSFALASILTLGALGCGSGRDNDREQPIIPLKDIPAVTAPVVKYDFYEPKSEEGLKRDTKYGYLIAKTRPDFKTAYFERLGLKVAGLIKASGASYYRLYKESDVLGALNRLQKISGVVFAEPEMKRYLYALETEPIVFDNIDPQVQNMLQWGAHTTRAYDAWTTYGFGPNRPVAASIDSGVQYNHEDLKSVVKHAYTWFNPAGNDYHDSYYETGDEYSWNPPDAKAVYPNNWGTDFDGHGTHTTGTICAAGNNGAGVAGMCWNVDFISYQGLGMGGAASNWTIYGSLWHLVNWKKANDYDYAIPVNCSLGGVQASRFEIDMIEYALQNDVLLIAASGNDSHRVHAFPAAYQGVMAVGASDGTDRRAPFSNYGPHISVVAPGVNVTSTVGAVSRHDRDSSGDLKNEYVVNSGTSMAAPHVTGLAAYMLTFNPDLKPFEIKTYIERYADYVGGANGYTEETGWGRINALNTIKAVIDDVDAGRTVNPSYAAAPVKINSSFNGLNVFLYNCNEAGTIQNYVASTITGYQFDAEEGAAYFNMLRPGRYIAHAYVGAANKVASTEPFEVAAGQKEVVEKVLDLGMEILFIQTFPTYDLMYSGFANVADPIIDFYDSGGSLIDSIDYYYWDTLVTVMPQEPGDYYIHVTDFYADSYLGEYALWVTTGSLWTPDNPGDWVSDGNTDYPVAPGTYADPLPAGGSAKSLHAQSPATAQPISLRTIYYGRFNGDAADGGTSGATGHYYKFTVAPQ